MYLQLCQTYVSIPLEIHFTKALYFTCNFQKISYEENVAKMYCICARNTDIEQDLLLIYLEKMSLFHCKAD